MRKALRCFEYGKTRTIVLDQQQVGGNGITGLAVLNRNTSGAVTKVTMEA